MELTMNQTIKKFGLLPFLLLPFYGPAANAAADLSSNQISNLQADETKTYVRCWYRPSGNHDNASTSWEWALKDNGSYYSIKGYWYSSTSWKNMFYTDTDQSEIRERCEATLNADYDGADITYFAADTRLSYNHTIWTNDTSSNDDNTSKINKVVTFGDSISDTGNLYNASQWLFPNDSSWFLGHFSNGLVWNEYVSLNKDLPNYNWAVAGAAGENQYVVLTGLTGQVDSYLEYMQLAKNYDTKDTLVTLEIGLNDFVNYDRSVAEVSADFTESVDKLVANGIENMVILALVDASIAPQFKYAEAGKADEVKAKIVEYNAYVEEEVTQYQAQGLNFVLYDTFSLFEDVVASPSNYGLRNTTDSCLDINQSSSGDYLKSHDLRSDCEAYGSDTYMFWGVTHPTTQTHKIIADEVIENVLPNFNF